MRRKFIRMVKVDGQEIVSHAGKTQALSAFFKSIIGVPGQATVFDLHHLYVSSPTPASGLSSPFSEAELKQSVQQMNQLSAPGPDGFGPAFFRVAWQTVRGNLLAFADAFFHGVADLERLNRSHMVLLPKKQDAVEVDSFKPICLQNCALKIITKTLTNRLQLEIPKLIDIHQTGFVKGRSISDTFVYALELVQICHKRKKAAIVLKLDFAKAFDTVNGQDSLLFFRQEGLIRGGLVGCNVSFLLQDRQCWLMVARDHGLVARGASGRVTRCPPTCLFWWQRRYNG
jgi:hypothetical protein